VRNQFGGGKENSRLLSSGFVHALGDKTLGWDDLSKRPG
jgi:hypothetical protein